MGKQNMPTKLSRRKHLPSRARILEAGATRKAIELFLENNTPRLTYLLDQLQFGIPKRNHNNKAILLDDQGAIVYQVSPNPDAAFKAISTILEYSLPKLSRSDVNNNTLNVSMDLKEMSMAQLLELRDMKRLEVTEQPVIEAEQFGIDHIDQRTLIPEEIEPPWMK